MENVTSRLELEAAVATHRLLGKTIGFVPTMGALHAGHGALVKQAAKENDVVVVSIFVNPTQFNNASDLANYPRTPEQDAALLKDAGAHIVFSPSVKEMYPDSPTTMPVELSNLSTVMEGRFRPGHFQGVVEIVRRLFQTVQPHRAYFGEKDFQQLAVIRHFVERENIPVEIVPCETVREPSGLAMSSRNMRLSDAQRKAASAISKALYWLRDSGKKYSLSDALKKASESIESDTGLKIEYLEVADEKNLQPAKEWKPGQRAFAAVFAGEIRLIDNVSLNK